MGAGAVKQLPPTVDEATQRRLGGACFDREIYQDLPDPNAVPRDRVLAEVKSRGLDGHGVIFWANLGHFFTVRRGLDEAWAAVPNREAVERGIAACDKVKTRSGDRRALPWFS